MTFRHTRYACYAGFVTQAIVNNLAPLFFIIFSESYGVSYQGLGGLVMLNFMVQLGIDALCVRFAARIGYRVLLVTAEAMSVAGLCLLGLLPLLMPGAVYAALALAVVVYAAGGGLLEVMLSPVVDSIPGDAEKKPAAMSFLHSFYCWGQMGVILLTTLVLSRIGRAGWFVLPLCWASVPLATLVFFLRVPLAPMIPPEEATGLGKLLKQPVFFLCLVLMLCGGASEQSVAQWASLFAEKALGLPKMTGDALGPALFALFMGLGRMIYGIWGKKIDLYAYMKGTALLCILCYLCMTLVSHPVAQLAACGLTGFAISIMWPAVVSLSSRRFPKGGAPLFAVLALLGDLGCGSGPWIAGLVSNAAEQGGFARSVSLFLSNGEVPLRVGILACVAFPAVFLVCLALFRREKVLS